MNKSNIVIESKLNKKHNSIAYHAVRWSVAAEIMRVGKVDTDDKTKIPNLPTLTPLSNDQPLFLGRVGDIYQRI